MRADLKTEGDFFTRYLRERPNPDGRHFRWNMWMLSGLAAFTVLMGILGEVRG